VWLDGYEKWLCIGVMKTWTFLCLALAGCYHAETITADPSVASQAGSGGATAGSGGASGSGSGGAPGGTESGSRLKARRYVATDGATQFVGWWDSERKENCGFARATDSKLRCLPVAVAASYFSDPGCTKPAALACEPPKYMGKAEASTLCGGETRTRIYLTGPSSGQAYYMGTPANCFAGSTLEGIYAYGVGAEVPASEFVAAAESVD
jgi:hypothetical protein